MVLQMIKVVMIASLAFGCNDQEGPRNLSRSEGEDNQEIHCPLSSSSAPIWKINSTLYEPLALKPLLSLTDYGISISTLDTTYNNTSFQCFLPNGIGLDVCKSTVGTLTVTKIDGYNPSKPEATQKIVLDHQYFRFNATHKTIAWRFENDVSCTPPVMFTIQSYTCDTANPIQSWKTQKSKLTLQSSAFTHGDDDLLYFSISAKDGNNMECSGMFSYFQVPTEADTTDVSIMLGDEACLKVPKIPEQQSLYAVWPSDDDVDCVCPLCDDGNCVLSNCKCHNSTFSPELRLVHTQSHDGISDYSHTICWSNLSKTQNNSKIHFFFEVHNCLDNNFSNLPVLSRVYIRSDNLILRGPPLPPVVTVDTTGNNVCFSSYTYYPVDYYIANIMDITLEEQTLNISTPINFQENKKCINLSEMSFPGQCSPYRVLVKSHNKAGYSSTSNITIIMQGDDDGDLCSCMEHKIMVDIDITQVTDTSLQLDIDCVQLQAKENRTFFIQLNSYNATLGSNNITLPCPKSLQFVELKPNTTLNITLVWFLDYRTCVKCVKNKTTTLPGLPSSPVLNVTGNLLCFNSHSYYPIIYYIIEVVDSTGDDLSFNISSSNETRICTNLSESNYAPECSPYNLTVRAYNEVGISSASNAIFQEDHHGNMCACMEHKAQMKVKISHITRSSVSCSIDCNRITSYKFNRFAIKVTNLENSTFQSQNITLPCPNAFTFNQLKANTSYTIVAIWFLKESTPIECNIEQFLTYSGVPPTPTLNRTDNSICFLLNSSYEVNYYIIKSTDITGDDKVFNVSNSNEKDTCFLLIDTYFPPECSPYQISARAYNDIGSSQISSISIKEDVTKNQSICSCMHQKIKVDVNVDQKTLPDIQLETDCSKSQTMNSSITEVLLKITPYYAYGKSGNETVDLLLPCPTSATQRMYMVLNSNTTYSISVTYQQQSIPIECMLMYFTTRSSAKTSGGNGDNAIIGPVLGSITSILFTAVIISVTISVLIYHRKMKRNETQGNTELCNMNKEQDNVDNVQNEQNRNGINGNNPNIVNREEGGEEQQENSNGGERHADMQGRVRHESVNPPHRGHDRTASRVHRKSARVKQEDMSRLPDHSGSYSHSLDHEPVNANLVNM